MCGINTLIGHVLGPESKLKRICKFQKITFQLVLRNSDFGRDKRIQNKSEENVENFDRTLLYAS